MFKDKTKQLLQLGPLKSSTSKHTPRIEIRMVFEIARPDAQKCQMDIAANVAMLIVVNSIPVRPGKVGLGGWGASRDGQPPMK